MPGHQNGHAIQLSEDDVRIDFDLERTLDGEVPKFPKEPRKLVLAVILLLTAAMCNDLVLAWIHERVPEYPPLPDLFFSQLPHFPSALFVSEYLIIGSLSLTLFVCFLHKHRWIVFRRLFFITALLYGGRAVSMLVTQVPVADPTYFCSPKQNETSLSLVLFRSVQLISGAGLSLEGKHNYCGDYIYSGHTLILVVSYLFIREYSPRRCHLLHWTVFASSLVGVFCLLVSRGHYSIDILIAYYVTTRAFWLYHTLANNPSLKESSQTNLLSRLFWFPLFKYMEANVNCVVPRQFEWPLPWPRFLRR